jgi:hypothetical protein
MGCRGGQPGGLVSNPGKRQGGQVTRLGRGHWPIGKEERQSGCWHYRGKEKAPRGFLGALMGTSMSIACEGRKEQKESEEQTEG